jgi:hypothetical protein
MSERTPKRPKEPHYTPDGDATWKQLMEIQKFGYGNSQIFRDFVDVALASLLSFTHNLQEPGWMERLRTNTLTGPYEDEYMRLVRKYRENKDRPHGQRPADYFAQAWAVLQEETRRNGQDIFGEIYMREITHGEHGQFFTPTHICDMVAQMTGGTEGEICSDPACGSGRFFISMSKINPNLSYHGIDVAEVCAKMTVLNMWMFDLNADIYCGNSLSMEMHRMWRVRKGGYIYEVPADQLRQEPPKRDEPASVPVAERQAADGDKAPIEQTAPPESIQRLVEQPPRPTADEPPPELLEQQTMFDMGVQPNRRMRRL